MMALGLALVAIALAGLIFAADQWGERSSAWAVALLVLGFAITITTGLCTGIAVVGTALDAARDVPHDLPPSTVITWALIVGGIPFLIGLATIRIAWNKYRSSRRADLAAATPDRDTSESP